MSRTDEPKTRARERPSSHLLPAGSSLGGKYRIERVLGEGVSSAVYVAQPLTDGGERVALKVIHRHLIKDRQISRRFHREASILRKLRCPNLVALLDFGELDDGVLFMALELVEGRSLEEILREAPIEPGRAVGIVKQICAALEAAHAAGIVHRDLKPGNVIVERTGAGVESARVLDFGMAKVLCGDPTDSLNLLTEQNMVFGTPEYMAPEQARGDEVDGRCDVYAAGVILYEMLAGSPPFHAATPVLVMTAHLAQAPTPPSRRSSARVSPALEAVVLHALAKNPKQRYPSAHAFAHALDGALLAPTDVLSIAPLGDELATRDTERALDVPALLAEHRTTHRSRPRGPESARHASEQAGRVWLIVAVAGALIGIILGILASIAAR